MHGKTIRVLLAEDSALFAESLVAILETSGDIEVVGVAVDGQQAVTLTRELRPDVVLMDVRMPVLGGLDAVQAIMEETPTPILVTTADPRGRTGALAFEALSRGALELVPKPLTWMGTDAEQDDLREKIRLLARIPVLARTRRQVAAVAAGAARNGPHAPGAAETGSGLAARPASTRPPRGVENRAQALVYPDPNLDRKIRIVAIGASTGGPAALAKLLTGLPANFPAPIVVVQHLSRGFEMQLATWLSSVTPLAVSVASARQVLGPGVVVLASGGSHLVVDAELRVRLDSSAERNGHRPSANVLFESVAETVGANALGLLLTGMGADGATGLARMRVAGAYTLAQDRESSAVYGMPKAAAELGAAVEIASLAKLPSILVRLATHGHRLEGARS